MVGRPDAEVFEEHVVHRRVVMLAAVHEDDLYVAARERVDDRLDLHVIRPRPSDTDGSHGSGPHSVSTLLPVSTRRQSST